MSGGVEAAFGAEKRASEKRELERREALKTSHTYCAKCGIGITLLQSEDGGGLCEECYSNLKILIPALRKLLKGGD